MAQTKRTKIPFLDKENEMPKKPRKAANRSKKTDWESLAKKLQEALETEIDENESLQRQLDDALEMMTTQMLAIRYLRTINGHNSV